MKRTFILTLVCLLALVSVGCRVVSGGSYSLRSGETLSSDLMVTGGDARLEPGSRVTGTLSVMGGSVRANGQIDGDVSVTGGSIDANGQIGGDVSVTGGSINFGSGAVVRGVVRKIGGGVNIAPGAKVEYGGSSGARNAGLVVTNVVRALSLAGIVFLAALVLFLMTRAGRPAVPLALTKQAAGATATVPPSAGVSSLAARGTGLSGNVVLGVILVGAGILFLLQEFLNLDVWHYAWPYLIVVAGLLFFAAMVLGGKSSGRLAIPGSILTILGLLFLYQDTFDQFESWAYAWALIIPTSFGIGHYIEGWWTGRPDLCEKGFQETRTGLIIFVVLAAFFELVINLSGFYTGDLGRFTFPALLILVGVLLLASRFLNWPGRKPAMGMPTGSGPAPSALPRESDKQPPAGR